MLRDLAVGCLLGPRSRSDRFFPCFVRAAAMCAPAGAQAIVLLHVPEGDRQPGAAHCLEQLRFLAPFNESHTVPVEHIVDEGNAADLIDRYVQKYAVDLLVLGSPERELAEQDFQSSTVLQVISRVHCPVLCLPAQTDVSTAEARHEAAIRPRLRCSQEGFSGFVATSVGSFVAAPLATDPARLQQDQGQRHPA